MLHGFRIVLTEPSKDIYCMESIHETKFFDNLNLLSMALRGDSRILLVFSILTCNTKINSFFAPHSSSKMPETGAAYRLPERSGNRFGHFSKNSSYNLKHQYFNSIYWFTQKHVQNPPHLAWSRGGSSTSTQPISATDSWECSQQSHVSIKLSVAEIRGLEVGAENSVIFHFFVP